MRIIHAKCGHIPYAKLWDMIKGGCVDGVDGDLLEKVSRSDFLAWAKGEVCVGCIMGKTNRRAMTGKIDHHAETVLAEWVVDVMGPVKILTLDDKKYILVIVDVYSHMVFASLLKSKEEVATEIIRIVKREQTQKEKKVKRTHSDGGKEIVNRTLKLFLEENGTVHTSTVPYTPQHNMCERMNRTILEMARALMHHCRAHASLWGYAVMMTVYLLQRTSTTTIPGRRTPLQVYSNVTHNINNLHVFGCDVFYHKHKVYREHKFDATASVAMFIGYDDNNDKYYHVLDVEEGKVKTTTDVTFYDTRFTQMEQFKKELADNNDDKSEKEREMNVDDYLDLDAFTPAQIEALFKPQGPSTTETTSQARDKMNRGDKNNNGDRKKQDKMNVEEENEGEHGGVGADTHDAIGRGEGHDRDDDERADAHGKSDSEEEEGEDGVGPSEDDEENENNNCRRSSDNSRINSSSATRRSTRVRAAPHRFVHDDYAHAALDEPLSYEEAVNGEHGQEWMKAINEELRSLQHNNTWTMVPRRADMNVIGCKWVLKVKRDVNGEVARYKARLVSKGYKQEQGIDYNETFAPVLKYKSLRVILCLSSTPAFVVEQLDIKTAFLNANVEEDIYVEAPEGVKADGNTVMKLNKAMYGIKQAPRAWNAHINAFLCELGFSALKKDPCIYIKNSNSNSTIIIGLFVDDIVVRYHVRDKQQWLGLKRRLKEKYELSDLGAAQHVLGMRIQRTAAGHIHLDQSVYVRSKLREYGMEQCKSLPTPAVKVSATASNGNSDAKVDATLYKAIVGSLLYASTSTRLDITHAVNVAARHMATPTSADMTAVKRILRYLSGASKRNQRGWTEYSVPAYTNLRSANPLRQLIHRYCPCSRLQRHCCRLLSGIRSIALVFLTTNVYAHKHTCRSCSHRCRWSATTLCGTRLGRAAHKLPQRTDTHTALFRVFLQKPLMDSGHIR